MQPLLLLTESLPDILQKKEKSYVQYAVITALVTIVFLGYSVWRLISFISVESDLKNVVACNSISNWLFDMELFYIFCIFTKLVTLFTFVMRSHVCYIPLLFLLAAEIPFRITFWNRYNLIGEAASSACYTNHIHETIVYEGVTLVAVYIENAVSIAIIISCYLLMKAAKAIREFKRIVTISVQRGGSSSSLY